MPKKRLTDIAQEYNRSFEEILDMVFNNLEEEMVTGRGKNTWISEEGQAVLDDIIPMPVIYRGQVLNACPNPLYLWVHHRDRACKVAVKIPRRMEGKLLNKVIYFEENRDGDNLTYHWVKR